MAIISLDISAIIADNANMDYGYDKINEALQLLDGRLKMNRSRSFSIVVCGGTALNAMHLIQRTTKDVDIVALMDSNNQLIDPAPLPEELLVAAKEVANTLNFPQDWLNNGPSSGDGGLFRLGLPDGFKERLIKNYQGEKLTVYFASRLDQIHFKLYAAVDQFGSYHASDLKQLSPSDEELLQAIDWAITHDPSEGFQTAIKLFLQEFGYERLVDTI
ncbi:MAG: nucleotidyl transferase AbiEii/AbiGii toxin family protein [Phycisphaerae bacterium]|nr:nucleotidyl transferase AbiEii/AbiGii toxin family protein [Phycisphaerae bacterium]